MKRHQFIILSVILLIVLSTGAAAAQNSYSLWFVDYWDNKDLDGTPVASDSTGVIDYFWNGSPKDGVPSNDWSGRWTSFVDFSPGTYRITTRNDDGVRVYLGDKHVILDWNEHGVVNNEVTVSLLGGSYPMAVDFFDDEGDAVLEVGWQLLGPPRSNLPDVTIIPSQPTPPPTPPIPQPNWLAQYWNNTSLSGHPTLTRVDPAINFDWGGGSPHPDIIDPDEFSARWSRSIYFETGTYQFTTQSDDGIRVYIDGDLIIDNWTEHALQTNTAEVTLAAGTHSVVVEYFEQKGLAVAKLTW
jgi:hypothetical protein